MTESSRNHPWEVVIDADGAALPGILVIPENSAALVLFAHGSGSSRLSPRNQEVASYLNQSGLGTLLFDLLTAEENEVDQFTREYRFDIDLLAARLVAAIDWSRQQPHLQALHLGVFGASTGAAAALIAAAERSDAVRAVVSRGGRPDLAGSALARVSAPTLLIVGGWDDVVIGLNEQAAEQLGGECKLEIVAQATHLFEEAGKLEEVCRLAAQWFRQQLLAAPAAAKR